MKESKEQVELIIDMAFEAGEILLDYQKKRHELEFIDKGVEGMASDADMASEKYIIERLQTLFPGDAILAEESHHHNGELSFEESLTKQRCWVVDPLDGTSNFINGIPIYCVAIGLMELGRPTLGVVYNPFSGECFFATDGGGAYLIDFRINPLKKYELNRESNDKAMRDCIFSPSPVYDMPDGFERQISVFKKNIEGTRAVRRFGSAAMELCYVANGNLDGYWEENLKPWDVVAAAVICFEAKVCVTDYSGRPFDILNKSIIAASDPLHSRIISTI